MASKRTNLCKKRSILFFCLSTLCWIGTALVVVICALSKVGGGDNTGMQIVSTAVKDKIVAFSTTAIIGIIVALFIKDKARHTIYMITLIIGAILWKETAMYIILTIWALDEYVFYTLYKFYKRKVEINKEIDLRE